MHIKELYQELILDHGTKPRNTGILSPCSTHAKGYNPLCGDRIHLYLQIDRETHQIIKASFEGVGCAISTASASIMTEALHGKTKDEALALFHYFQRMMVPNEHSKDNSAEYNKNNSKEKIKENQKDMVDCEAFTKLTAFQGVTDYPARVKCATLAWHALHAALTEIQEKD